MREKIDYKINKQNKKRRFAVRVMVLWSGVFLSSKLRDDFFEKDAEILLTLTCQTPYHYN